MSKGLKKARLAQAEARIDEIPGLNKFSDWHWFVELPQYGVHVDYWPTTGKWSNPTEADLPTTGDFDAFKKFIEEIRQTTTST